MTTGWVRRRSIVAAAGRRSSKRTTTPRMFYTSGTRPAGGPKGAVVHPQRHHQLGNEQCLTWPGRQHCALMPSRFDATEAFPVIVPVNKRAALSRHRLPLGHDSQHRRRRAKLVMTHHFDRAAIARIDFAAERLDSLGGPCPRLPCRYSTTRTSRTTTRRAFEGFRTRGRRRHPKLVKRICVRTSPFGSPGTRLRTHRDVGRLAMNAGGGFT